jgi:hypothetical protein
MTFSSGPSALAPGEAGGFATQPTHPGARRDHLIVTAGCRIPPTRNCLGQYRRHDPRRGTPSVKTRFWPVLIENADAITAVL